MLSSPRGLDKTMRIFPVFAGDRPPSTLRNGVRLKTGRVNSSVLLLRASPADWQLRWRQGLGRDDTRTQPYPDPRANRADASNADRRGRKSPPTSSPLAPLPHQRRARTESVPRRHRPSRTTNRRASEAKRCLRRKRAGSAEQATQKSEPLLKSLQRASSRPFAEALRVTTVRSRRGKALHPAPRQVWYSAPCRRPAAQSPDLGSRM